jgi:hypothetical protein
MANTNSLIPPNTPYPPGVGNAPVSLRNAKRTAPAQLAQGLEDTAKALENLQASHNVVHKALRTGIASAGQANGQVPQVWTISTDTVLKPASQTVQGNTTAADVAAILPPFAQWIGKDITLVKITSDAHAFNWLAAIGDRVNGAGSGSLTIQWQTITIRSTGAGTAEIVSAAVAVSPSPDTIAPVSVDTTLGLGPQIVPVNTGAGNVTITLPDATQMKGARITIYKASNDAHTVILNGKIDGALSLTLTDYNQSVTVEAVATAATDWKTVSSAVSVSSVAPTAPGDVTIDAVAVDPDPENFTRGVTVAYTPPSPVGTFKGVWLQIEAPDQSTVPSATMGATPLDGSVNLSGPKRPLTFGPFADADVAGTIRVLIPEPEAIALPMTARLRLVSYSDQITADVDAAPSVTFTIDPRGAVNPLTGTAYCQNGTLTIPPLAPDGSANPSTETISGKSRTHLWVGMTAPVDPDWKGAVYVLRDGFGSVFYKSAPTAGTSVELIFDTPATVGTYYLYAPGWDGSNTNPVVPGITPSLPVAIGVATGTTDPTSLIVAKLGDALTIADDALRMKLGPALDFLNDEVVVKVGSALKTTNDILEMVLGSALAYVNSALDVKAGGIVAAHISSVNASVITGLIAANQIDKVNASQINGLILANQINSVNANQIVGTFAANQISSVYANTISGLIAANQINTINANQINGVVAVAGNVQNITANTVNLIGTWADSQIGSISAGKITAGTLAAGVVYAGTLAVTNITGWGGSTIDLGANDLTFSGSAGCQFQNTSTGQHAYAEAGGFTVGTRGAGFTLGASGLFRGATKIVGAQQPAIANGSDPTTNAILAAIRAHGLIAT